MNHYRHLKSQLEKLTAKHELSEAALEEIQAVMARYAMQAMTTPAVAKEAKKVLQDHFVKFLLKHKESQTIEI
jgi:hypothetical protein